MCGICGAIRRGGPVSSSIARQMLQSLTHRGPDDEGFVKFVHGDRHAFLGSRRLAIIDLSPAGRQPILNEDASIALIYNGEVYNFLSLRDDLLRRGHRFHSRTDSEVIVHGYEEFGAGIFSKLDGMFAVALWDGRTGSLVLARDRWGKKPLYYYEYEGGLVFASEIKALLAHPAVPVELDPEILPQYLIHGYVHEPGTFYRGIHQVPAASILEFGPDGTARRATYWSLRFPAQGNEQRLTEGEAAEAVRALLRSAVRKRLISDVPLGALLSGGLDSSVVVYLMSEVAEKPVLTFTAGFLDDPSYDERPYARVVAEAFGTTHTEFVANGQDAPALLEKLLWYHDQPYGDSSAIPTYLVCGLTRRAVTVALVGDGGDEVFAGYDRFRAALLADRIPTPVAGALGAALRLLPAAQGYYSRLTRLRRFGQGLGAGLGPRYLQWVAVIPPQSAAELLVPQLAGGVEAVEAQVEAILDEMRDAHPLHRLMHLNLRTYLPGDLLVKMDRMSMAQSLETRSPFLDVGLVEFVSSLPASYKIQGAQQKSLLRRAFADRLPRAVTTRAKHGFGVPLDAWFRGPLRSRVSDELLASDARVGSYLEPRVLRRLADAHLAGRENYGQALWTLLNLEVWLRELPTWPKRAGRNG